jgi:antitoxin PrlF
MPVTVHISKLTSKGQTTIPSAIRKTLGIKTGDFVMFSVENAQVIVKRAEKLDAGLLKLAQDSFSDWNAPEADEAFRDL